MAGKGWAYAALAAAVVGALVWQYADVATGPDDRYQDSSTSAAALVRPVDAGSGAPSEHGRDNRPAEDTALALPTNAAAQDVRDAIKAVQAEARNRQRSSFTVQTETAASEVAPARNLADAISLVQTASDSRQPSFSAAKSPALTAEAPPLDEAVKGAQYLSAKQQIEIPVAYPFLVQNTERSPNPSALPRALRGAR